MDKKKIFILILLFVLKFNLSFGAEITIDLQREKINLLSKDPEINGKLLNLSDLDKIRKFDYFLINQKIVKINKKFKKSNFILDNSFVVDDNKKIFKEKILNNLKSNISLIEIDETKLEQFSRQFIKEKNFNYLLKREIFKNFESDWYYKRDKNNYVIQKSVNLSLEKNNLLFFYDFKDAKGLEKVNFVFEIKKGKNSYKYIKGIIASSDNQFIFKNIENNRSYGFFIPKIKDNIKNYENDNYKIKLKEIVLFVHKNDFSEIIKSFRYKIFNYDYNEFVIYNNLKNQFIIPSKQKNLFKEIKDLINEELEHNILHNFANYKNYYTKDISYDYTKKYWESSLLTLFKILSEKLNEEKIDNLDLEWENDIAIYIPNLNDEELKLNIIGKDFFNISYLFKLLINTLLFLILLIIIFNLKIRIINIYLNKLIFLNIILFISIFTTYMLNILVGIYLTNIITSFFGILIFLNSILIILIKNGSQTINNNYE